MSDPLLPVSTNTEIDIPFQDIDAMEIVWHGNYPRYLEIARCALLDCIDYDYPANARFRLRLARDRYAHQIHQAAAFQTAHSRTQRNKRVRKSLKN
jgi:acyl-CoA thioesterase FadM